MAYRPFHIKVFNTWKEAIKYAKRWNSVYKVEVNPPSPADNMDYAVFLFNNKK